MKNRVFLRLLFMFVIVVCLTLAIMIRSSTGQEEFKEGAIGGLTIYSTAGQYEFKIPIGAKQIGYYIVGGGGGGGFGFGSTGSGGGGGAVSYSDLMDITGSGFAVGNSYIVTIGSSGNGAISGTNSTAGGASIIECRVPPTAGVAPILPTCSGFTTIKCNGGGGGGSGSKTEGGIGGVSAGGKVNITGANGARSGTLNAGIAGDKGTEVTLSFGKYQYGAGGASGKIGTNPPNSNRIPKGGSIGGGDGCLLYNNEVFKSATAGTCGGGGGGGAGASDGAAGAAGGAGYCVIMCI